LFLRAIPTHTQAEQHQYAASLVRIVNKCTYYCSTIVIATSDSLNASVSVSRITQSCYTSYHY